jgi:hypothetical protein
MKPGCAISAHLQAGRPSDEGNNNRMAPAVAGAIAPPGLVRLCRVVTLRVNMAPQCAWQQPVP